MAFGPGKYDSIATFVRAITNAEFVLVAIIGGSKGDGFAVQVAALDILGALQKQAAALRIILSQMDQDIEQLSRQKGPPQ